MVLPFLLLIMCEQQGAFLFALRILNPLRHCRTKPIVDFIRIVTFL